MRKCNIINDKYYISVKQWQFRTIAIWWSFKPYTYINLLYKLKYFIKTYNIYKITTFTYLYDDTILHFEKSFNDFWPNFLVFWPTVRPLNLLHILLEQEQQWPQAPQTLYQKKVQIFFIALGSYWHSPDRTFAQRKGAGMFRLHPKVYK